MQHLRPSLDRNPLSDATANACFSTHLGNSFSGLFDGGRRMYFVEEKVPFWHSGAVDIVDFLMFISISSYKFSSSAGNNIKIINTTNAVLSYVFYVKFTVQQLTNT